MKNALQQQTALDPLGLSRARLLNVTQYQVWVANLTWARSRLFYPLCFPHSDLVKMSHKGRPWGPIQVVSGQQT